MLRDPVPNTLSAGTATRTSVARAVLFCMVDPNDDTTRLLGTPKNNLGRSDLPTLSFHIEGSKVAETAEGDVWTGRLVWTGESDRSIRDALQEATEAGSSITKTAATEAGDWLTDYLTEQGGSADSATLAGRPTEPGASANSFPPRITDTRRSALRPCTPSLVRRSFTVDPGSARLVLHPMERTGLGVPKVNVPSGFQISSRNSMIEMSSGGPSGGLYPGGASYACTTLK